jgi:hypothetical protein
MTPDRPGDRPRPFTSAELDGVPDRAPEDLAAERRLAREIEGAADRGTVRPSADFADRVMRAVAAEPGPAPVRAAGAALRHGSIAALFGSIRDAWRVSMGTGFPVAARAQALALVLIVGVFAAGSGVATAGALGVFNEHPAPVVPSPSVSPATPFTESATPEMSPAPQPTDGSLDPAATATPGASDASESPSNEPQETVEPGETPESNGGSSGDLGSTETTRSTATTRPDRTPEPASTEDGHQGPTPSPTSKPGATPRPSEIPEPTPGH